MTGPVELEMMEIAKGFAIPLVLIIVSLLGVKRQAGYT